MDTIDRVRRFNRFYTARIGLLKSTYAGTGMPLSQARVLIELADRESWSPKRCAEALGLDGGYLSRIIQRLKAQGWIAQAADAGDRRMREIRITAAGREVVAALRQSARADLGRRLQGCSPAALKAAVNALENAAALMTPHAAGQGTGLRDMAPGDMGWIIQQHGEYYHETCGFDARFEQLVAEILCAFCAGYDPNRERAFVAERAGRRLGSVFCVTNEAPGTAQLRLFYLRPEARGLGLGRRMLDACVGFAREAGYTRMILWTHESHRAACALYEANGFEIENRKPVEAFGTDQIEVSYARAL